MAIDPYSRTMFWVDTQAHVINVTRLNGEAVGVVYDDATDKPESLAISPEDG